MAESTLKGPKTSNSASYESKISLTISLTVVDVFPQISWSKWNFLVLLPLFFLMVTFRLLETNGSRLVSDLEKTRIGSYKKLPLENGREESNHRSPIIYQPNHKPILRLHHHLKPWILKTTLSFPSVTLAPISTTLVCSFRQETKTSSLLERSPRGKVGIEKWVNFFPLSLWMKMTCFQNILKVFE